MKMLERPPPPDLLKTPLMRMNAQKGDLVFPDVRNKKGWNSHWSLLLWTLKKDEGDDGHIEKTLQNAPPRPF